MSGEADGYGDYGGGGSVHYSIKIGEGQRPVPKPKHPADQNSPNKHVYTVDGVDTYMKSPQADQGYFEITIKQPVGSDILAVATPSEVKLYLPVNRLPAGTVYDALQHRQITVAWGDAVVKPAVASSLLAALTGV
jgi:hypothetical protein